VLLLRLAGPLQAWGDSSRFARRETGTEPTKSGVIGLIAAAQGRRRTDPIEDLTHLIYGVRTEQPGRLIRDFQTARSLDGSRTMPLSYRYYLADAVFLAGLEADAALLEGIHEAVTSPAFPLYLGRRSCPPTGIVSLGIRHGTLVDVLRQEKWHASEYHQKRTRANRVELPLVRDALAAGERGDIIRDLPLSFDPERREYDWRTIVHEPAVVVCNPFGVTDVPPPGSAHEPMALLEAQ
jgi:CRISPR system Cascade subunit CasD